jgi:salicylate hydroxylase
MANMETSREPVLVVGGGIGGVAAALAFARHGWPVRLLEQAEQIGAIGYGVQLGPNVVPMLRALGVEEAARRAAYLPTQLRLHDMDSGETLFDIPLRTPAFDARYGGSPYMAIHRVDLHELLVAACRRHPGIDLDQSTTVARFDHTERGASVTTSDERTIAGAAVIAADGLRSRLGAQLHPNDTSRDTGYVAHRTIVPMDAAPASIRQHTGVVMWTGPGFHVIYYPLRGRSEMNIVVVVRVPAGIAAEDNARYRNHLAALTAHARPEVRDVLALVNLERRWSIADRHPVRHWSERCVTLLGDSAHATLQSLAQGAGMALEDAVLLPALVTRFEGDFAHAFKAFEQQRFLRTARVQLESRALWEQYHCDGAQAAVRSAQWQERSAEDFYRCLDWLWKPELPVGLTHSTVSKLLQETP